MRFLMSDEYTEQMTIADCVNRLRELATQCTTAEHWDHLWKMAEDYMTAIERHYTSQRVGIVGWPSVALRPNVQDIDPAPGVDYTERATAQPEPGNFNAVTEAGPKPGVDFPA